MIASKKIASDILLFGLFWICIFGEWHTVKAFGDDSYIYLVDFDETAYDMYIQGYYPTDYTYVDFRRDSIEGMVSHYVATDNNNFGAIVDTVENAVINDGWSAIKDFFENAWIDLKSGAVTVEEGFTDDFKHELDGRFKITPPSGSVTIGSGQWLELGSSQLGYYWANSSKQVYGPYSLWTSGATAYVTSFPNGNSVICSYVDGTVVYLGYYVGDRARQHNTCHTNSGFGGLGGSTAVIFPQSSSFTDWGYPSGWTYQQIIDDFWGHSPQSSSEPYWSGDGYYSNTPMNYSINLPALPAIDWRSISNNNKTKYGVDFPDVNVSVDFQLPDMYYPKTVTYDVPYWLQNGDETSVDWQHVSFDDVTLPSVELSDGDGTFFQNLFLCLPVGFASLLLGVILCYLIFLLL